MEFLWLVIWVVLAVVAIVDLIRVQLSAVKKLLWVLLILCVPLLGVVLYYLLGRPEQLRSA